MEKQRSKEWFEKRKGKVTGSSVGAILGLDPWKKPEDVMRAMVREYHGAEAEFKGNIVTQLGKNFEEYAMADFEIESGTDATPTGFHVHPEETWIGASPDALIESDAVLEIKCPYSKRESPSGEFESYTSQGHYYAQMQIEMYCTGRKECYFYQWGFAGSRLEVVEYSQTWIDDNLPKLKAFYERYISELENEDHLDDLVQAMEAPDLAEEYIGAKVAMEEAKQRLESAKIALVEKAGGKKSNISGLLVYPIKRSGSVSYAKVVKDHLQGVDVEPYRGKESLSWAIR